MCKMKRIGPSTESCGTPLLTLVHEEETNMNKLVSNNLNQSRAVPPIPMISSNLCNRMLWSSVSKARLRSGRTSIESNPLSEALTRSLAVLLLTFIFIFYVLQRRALNPDWNSSNTPFLCRWSSNWIIAHLLNNFRHKRKSLTPGLLQAPASALHHAPAAALLAVSSEVQKSEPWGPCSSSKWQVWVQPAAVRFRRRMEWALNYHIMYHQRFRQDFDRFGAFCGAPWALGLGHLMQVYATPICGICHRTAQSSFMKFWTMKWLSFCWGCNEAWGLLYLYLSWEILAHFECFWFVVLQS